MNPLQERVRQDNVRQILDLIRRRDGIAQRDLVIETGLRPSTVSNLVSELRGGGLIRTLGQRASGSTGGKPAVMIGLEPDRGWYVGMLWDADSIAACVTDFSGAIVGTIWRRAIDTTEPFLETLLSHTLKHIAGIRSADPTKKDTEILGVGLVVGSIVDRDGAILPSADFPWQIESPVETIREMFHLPHQTPVLIENDANTIALDARRVLPEVPETILGIVVTDSARTTGAGIIVHDRLVRGYNGSAGELIDPSARDDSQSLKGRTHPLEEIDRICAGAIRFFDPDFVAIAGPETVNLKDLPALERTIGTRPYRWSHQTGAALLGATYMAHRGYVAGVIQGGVL